MLAVVLSFDHLPLSLLGCYGHPWVQTPCFNEIAAKSVTFDLHFGEDFSPIPDGCAWWTGCYHFPRGGEFVPQRLSLPRWLHQAEVETRWLSDVEASPITPFPPEFPASLAGSFEQLIERGGQILENWLTQAERPQLLWLKSGELNFASSSIQDPTEPRPAEATVEHLDEAVEPLWELIQSQSEQREILFIITAARGMPVKWATQFPETQAAWSETFVHLPLILYSSTVEGAQRRRSLTQTLDLPATLLDWFAALPAEGIEGHSLLPVLRGEEFMPRTCLTWGSNAGWEAWRTEDFYLVRGKDPEREPGSFLNLFMKPDDVWDVQDVAAQEPEIAETLSAKLDAFFAIARTQAPLPLNGGSNPRDVCGETTVG